MGQSGERQRTESTEESGRAGVRGDAGSSSEGVCEKAGISWRDPLVPQFGTEP